MSNFVKPEIEVDVERLDSEIIQKQLDSDIIDEHLRNSTAVLQDILKCSEVIEYSPTEFKEGHMCQHCGKIYKTISTLHAHCLLIHPQNAVEGQCMSCDKKYPSLLSLQKHIRYKHRYEHRCKACYRTFATAELLFAHGEVCSKTETPCSQCGKVFDSPLALRNHIKYKHPEKRNHWCELCRRTFTTERRLMNHIATIHPPGATDCNWCDRSFSSITGMQSHILYRHTSDGAKCFKCHKVFAKKVCLQRHLAKNHFFPTSLNDEDTGSSTSENFNK